MSRAEKTTTYSCVVCRDTGFKPVQQEINGVIQEGVTRCPHVREQLAAKRAIIVFGRQYVKSAKLADLTPQEFDTVREKAEQFIDGWGSGAGLMILGNVGVGKSHLASVIANTLLQFNCRSMTFATVPVVLERHRRAMFDDQSTIEVAPMGYALRDCELLVLDDLGAEKASEFTEDFLYGIVSHRHGELAPIIVTANCTLSTLEQQIGIRTLDRLMGFCGGEPVLMEGESRRWKRRK